MKSFIFINSFLLNFKSDADTCKNNEYSQKGRMVATLLVHCAQYHCCYTGMEVHAFSEWRDKENGYT